MMTPLEALKRIRQETCPATYNSDFDKNECCNIIEQALKEYEMEHTLRVILENTNYKLVREKQDNEKKLKALEIIKKKRVSIDTLDAWNWDIEKYNERRTKEQKLTQEEYDLLKEVFE